MSTGSVMDSQFPCLIQIYFVHSNKSLKISLALERKILQNALVSGVMQA